MILKQIIPRFLILTFLISKFCATDLYSQEATSSVIELDLLYQFQKLHKFRQEDNYDSLVIQNQLIMEKFNNYIICYPFISVYDFQLLTDSNYIDIASDKNNALRIYSWDDQQGGTMRYFNNIFQYKVRNKIFTKMIFCDGMGSCAFYHDIYTLETNDNIFYLTLSTSILSTKDCAQTLDIFSIADTVLQAKNEIVKTQDGMTGSIEIGYDFFSVYKRLERPIRLIRYDTTNKIIEIPIIDENDQVTDSIVKYQFNGKYFELIMK